MMVFNVYVNDTVPLM